jgi:hypothetical protein
MEESTVKRFSRLYTAVALGLGVTAAPYAFAQDAGLNRQQQVKQENDRKKEQKRENRDNEQLTRQERREAKREREQLNNMPKPVREALRSDTAQAGVKDVDYYRVEAEGGKGNAGREFGARFTAANGHKMDVRVDRDGKLLSRQDLTQAATASAQTPATAAQQPAPATPTTPGTPATPAPGSATASTEAPESGNAIYRRLQATEVPANIRTIFDKDTTKASDVRYYRTKYGSQLAYEVKYTDASGKEMRHYVSDAGQTLVQGESKDDDNEKLASAADRRERDRDRNRDRDRDNTARRDDRDRDRDSSARRDDRDRRDDAVHMQHPGRIRLGTSGVEPHRRGDHGESQH